MYYMLKNKVIKIFVLFIFILVVCLVVYNSDKGVELNLLIVGDSIGEGAGASTPELKWYKYLIPYMRDTYHVDLNITNVSMGGNTSYAGYARVMQLEDGKEYDLAIVCYGQNDKLEKFSLYYESILRAIRNKYPACSVITVLESSQREYTEKIRVIQNLSQRYNVFVADTIAAFENSEKSYEELCDDGTHPNDEGQKLYYRAIKDIIDIYMSGNHTENIVTELPVNQEVVHFDNFEYYSVKKFHKINELTYELNINAPPGILGIDYMLLKGESVISIIIDDKKICDKQLGCDNDYNQRFIEKIVDDCAIGSTLTIVFSSAEQAKAFNGIIVNAYEF